MCVQAACGCSAHSTAHLWGGALPSASAAGCTRRLQHLQRAGQRLQLVEACGDQAAAATAGHGANIVTCRRDCYGPRRNCLRLLLLQLHLLWQAERGLAKIMRARSLLQQRRHGHIHSHSGCCCWRVALRPVRCC
jgi:hypothetical protein